MNLTELLYTIAQFTLLLIAALTVIDVIRFGGQVRLDIALMFGSLASIVLLQGLAMALRQQAPWLTRFGAVLLLSQPYLLLRLVQHFRHVPHLVRWAAMSSLIISWLILLAIPSPRPLLLTLLVIANFVLVEGYAALAFIHGARQTGGATRPRLALAATGSTLLMLVLLLAGVNQVMSSNTGLTTPLTGLIACLAMISYYLAFTPPRWLYRSWQLTELQRFLSKTSGQPAQERVTTALEHLCHVGTDTVGGLVACIALWNENNQCLEITLSSSSVLHNDSFKPVTGALAQAWNQRQPIIATNLAEFGADTAVVTETDARAIFIIPITTPLQIWGLLLVFFNQVPLFASDGVYLLTLLAEQSAIALEYASLLSKQETLLAELRVRNAQVEATNHELEAFSYSVAHDLRAPLRSLVGFSQALIEDYGHQLDSQGHNYLQRIAASGSRMGELIDGLLTLSRITRGELQQEAVDLSTMAYDIVADLQQRNGERAVIWSWASETTVHGDSRLLRVLLENLLGNAWKFTAPCPQAEIEIGSQSDTVEPIFFVRDTGVGFDLAYAEKLFGVFQRLHSAGEFEGTGIGLATAQRIVHRHGGRIWATGAVGEGATFFFTLQ